MFDLLIVNGRIMTFDLEDKVIEKGYIAIKGKKILDIGLFDDTFIVPDSKIIIDAEGKIVTPGFIDCHTHAVYAGDRSSEFEQRLNGKSYKQILREGGGILSTVNETRNATHDSLARSALNRINTMLRYGTTSVEIKSGYGLNISSETKILEVANSLKYKTPVTIHTTFLGAHAIPPEYKNDSDSYVDHLIKDMLPYVKKNNLATFIDAFCEDIAFSTDQIDRLFIAAKSLGFKLKVHAEQLSNQGASVMASKHKAISIDHLEHLTPEDCKNISIFNKEIVAVLLPGAFYFLKETVKPPVESLRKHGIKIAIATDSNPGTSPFLSLPLMMNIACLYFGITILEAFRAVTINAAHALASSDIVGSLEKDKNADIIIWSAGTLSSIVYNPNENFCYKIIKNGALCTN
jgi:imidazolonepropionase